MDPQAPSWNSLELRLLNTLDIFLHKPSIMKKAEAQLESLNQTLQAFLEKNPGTCPPEADTLKGQIARGENHKGFPFLSLDMPQLFNKEKFFTFRTLFWWGHYLGFSLILKGKELEPLVNNLAANAERDENIEVYFSIAPTPWEWSTAEGSILPLDKISRSDIASHWTQKGFVKLLKVYPMKNEIFAGLDWNEKGLQAFREFIRLVGK